MCNANCIIFGVKNLSKSEVNGKKVIEVGSYNVNGSLRPLLESWKPSSYIGVDILIGPGVDVICSADDLIKKFGKDSFNVVIATELLEHVRDWRKTISNLKGICKPSGIILITTRSRGFPYHGFPFDFWRYEVEDMEEIFSDFIIQAIAKDNEREPGVFIKLKKPIKFIEKDLDDYKIYSIIAKKCVQSINENEVNAFKSRHKRKTLLNKIISRFYKLEK